MLFAVLLATARAEREGGDGKEFEKTHPLTVCLHLDSKIGANAGADLHAPSNQGILETSVVICNNVMHHLRHVLLRPSLILLQHQEVLLFRLRGGHKWS